MTREEASFILANIDRRVCDDELSEALDMAIKALEQESVLDKIRTEIDQEQKELESYPSKDNDVYCEINACKRHIAIIDKYKAESESKE